MDDEVNVSSTSSSLSPATFPPAISTTSLTDWFLIKGRMLFDSSIAFEEKRDFEVPFWSPTSTSVKWWETCGVWVKTADSCSSRALQGHLVPFLISNRSKQSLKEVEYCLKLFLCRGRKCIIYFWFIINLILRSWASDWKWEIMSQGW